MADHPIFAEILRVLDLEARAIQACADRLRVGTAKDSHILHAIDLLNEALNRGGKIIVTGVGKSGRIGQKIAATLSSTGSRAVFLHPTEGLHGDIGLVAPQDVVLALSYTGNTQELLQLIPSLKQLGVPVIGLGGNRSSRLAEACQVWIDGYVDQEACPHNLAPTTSTTLALALGDALAVALMHRRGFQAKDFAQNHPGGSLGKRLTLTVADIMHHGAELPCVAATATMDDVIGATTRGKLGAALVVEGERFLGLITDFDLRKALQHREKFFNLVARDVMNAKPITAAPDLMAASALDLMQNRPSPISVLPVVDAHGHWKGILHLHDLVQAF